MTPFRKSLFLLMAVAVVAFVSCWRSTPSAGQDNAIQIPNEQFVAYMKHYLDDGYRVRMVPKGNSMLPTLKNGEELVTLEHTAHVKPRDIVLALTDNGHYVIHRVLMVRGNTVTLKGDHNTTTEKARLEDVLARMVEVQPVPRASKIRRKADATFRYMANPAFRIDAVDSLAWMVDTLNRQVDMHNAIVFNETALFLWKKVGRQPFSLNDMKDTLMDAYEVDDSLALGDCRKLLEEWMECELVVPVEHPGR